MASQLPPVASKANTPMQPEFPQPHERPPPFQMELQVLSNNMLQIDHTNQAMLSFLFAKSELSQDWANSKVLPKLSGLPFEDVLAWLDHFEMISRYH